MANKKCRAIDIDELNLIIDTIRDGYYDDSPALPNKRVALALLLEAQLGIRVSDVCRFTLGNIIIEDDRYRLHLVEKKTGKVRNFMIPERVYTYILNYCLENGIGKNDVIVDVTERTIQLTLRRAVKYLGISGNVSTHSFRKFFATSMYQNTDYNIALVSRLLNHSNTSITQRYIGVSDKDIDDALSKFVIV